MKTLKLLLRLNLGFAILIGNKVTKKRLRFLTRIMATRVFSKLSLRDKITAIAKLIMISQNDFGAAPKELGKTLLSLSRDLKRQELDQICSPYPPSKSLKISD